MKNQIIINNVTKKYHSLIAVNQVSLKISRDRVFALLGLNGAGKTTLIKMIAGLLKPTDGEIIVFDNNLKTQLNEAKKIMAISPQDNAIANKLTVYENLMLMAKIFSQSIKTAKTNIDRLLKEFSLEKYRNLLASKLSGGYKRKLSIAMALISQPEVLFLDEPTVGLDIISRNDLWKIIERMKSKTTIILTTHYLEEAEKLADDIAFMKDGKISIFGTKEEIYAKTETSTLEEAFLKVMRV